LVKHANARHCVLRYAAEPELEREPDMLLLMKEHDLLAQLLLNQSEAERTSSPMEHARLLSALAAREADLEHEVQERTQALLAAEDALRQSQKMEAVGQLTGGLARDFNNMLTGIIGNLELLQRRIAQGRISEIERYIVAAQNAAQRAATLTHRLLAFVRRQPLDTKSSDINQIVLGDMRYIRGGTFDDTSWVVPQIHFWIRSKQPWLVLPDDATAHPTQPGHSGQ